MQKNIEEILKILRYAIKQETNAFMGYYTASKNVGAQELKGTLLYLAEEERKHKIILLKEYNNLLKVYGLNNTKRIPKIKEYEIRYRISKNYKPKSLQIIPEIDLSGVSFPMEIVGGDYLDTFPIRDDEKGINRLGIILYDAMGHGLPATYIKSITRSIFQKLGEDFYNNKNVKIFKPSKIVTEINRVITKKCQHEGFFVTLFYCVIDPEKGKLSYTSAGHEPPIYISKNNHLIEQLT
ncbi:MAG: SpoIIE family protein phosphatase, partial [Candidatus Helarchaeota archaeon]|nr:SpoIIE family protein phosphatase [Candidatus Helarchaeota archaeon]